MMNTLGCLDVPTDGTYKLDGIDVGALDGGHPAMRAARLRPLDALRFQ